MKKSINEVFKIVESPDPSVVAPRFNDLGTPLLTELMNFNNTVAEDFAVKQEVSSNKSVNNESLSNTSSEQPKPIFPSAVNTLDYETKVGIISVKCVSCLFYENFVVVITEKNAQIQYIPSPDPANSFNIKYTDNIRHLNASAEVMSIGVVFDMPSTPYIVQVYLVVK